MDDQKYIKYCLLQIEKKLEWQDPNSWKESDFKKLSEIIGESTKITISPHTLKRLFGKIKYDNKYYNPQQATKDALAMYLDYKDWDDFVLRNRDNEIGKKAVLHKWRLQGKSLAIVPSIIMFGILLTLVLTNQFSKSNRIASDLYAFEVVDSVGTVPFTVNINYDVSKIESDSVFLDFDFRHPFTGTQIIKVDKERSNYNFTYQVPGYYQPSLLYENQKLQTENVLVMSDGWTSYIVYENDMTRFWLDNEVVDSIQDGYLYINPKEIKRQGLETVSVFYVIHRLFKQFNIDGDNFQFKTRFKNSNETGGITCFDSVFRFICEEGESHVLLMEEGCSQYSELKFGEKTLHGEYEDLSALKLETGGWNEMSITVKQKKVEVFVNDTSIYQGDYKQSNGQIVGIQVKFKGMGMIDFVELQDLGSKKNFFESFQ